MNIETVSSEIGKLTGNNSGLAIGNDLVHLPTFLQSLNCSFIRLAFTDDERTYCCRFDDPLLRYASTWAAKEAVYKALKQSDEHLKIWWRQIEIHRDQPQGRPKVHIRKAGVFPDVGLTISHDGDYVWAIAICPLHCCAPACH